MKYIVIFHTKKGFLIPLDLQKWQTYNSQHFLQKFLQRIALKVRRRSHLHQFKIYLTSGAFFSGNFHVQALNFMSMRI